LPRHVPFEDLVHAGVVGLIDALQKYDKGKHVMFGSYAKFRIRGAILDSLRGLDWAPRKQRKRTKQIEAAICAAEQRLHSFGESYQHLAEGPHCSDATTSPLAAVGAGQIAARLVRER